jgi:hypothetical protein
MKSSQDNFGKAGESRANVGPASGWLNVASIAAGQEQSEGAKFPETPFKASFPRATDGLAANPERVVRSKLRE